MTSKQRTAIKALMYAFNVYASDRVGYASFMPDANNRKNVMGFGEAYNVCARMLAEDIKADKKGGTND